MKLPNTIFIILSTDSSRFYFFTKQLDIISFFFLRCELHRIFGLYDDIFLLRLFHLVQYRSFHLLRNNHCELWIYCKWHDSFKWHFHRLRKMGFILYCQVWIMCYSVYVQQDLSMYCLNCSTFTWKCLYRNTCSMRGLIFVCVCECIYLYIRI